MNKLVKIWTSTSLIFKIVVGLVIGLLLGILFPQASWISIFGTLFVSALKSIAPVLVFVLIASSIANASLTSGKRFKTVIFLYIITTLLAAIVAVFASYIFPVSMKLAKAATDMTPPQKISLVFQNLLTSIFVNPVSAVASGNYLSILAWGVFFGLALKKLDAKFTKDSISQVSDAVNKIVRWIINLAPFGIMGIVFDNVSTNGIAIFADYGKLLLLLVGTMLVVALILNPLIAFVFIKKNPYPLLFTCLKESGITAFFTRSSAANIPVNMALCEKLGLDKEVYSVSLPLGATINMDGAAVTITIMTLATAHTLGIEISLPSAILLSFLATLAACGASGVAGGSLLLIPMACSLFGISNDIAMQTVAVGFIIGVIQDSCETALNSSGDVFITAVAEMHDKAKEK